MTDFINGILYGLFVLVPVWLVGLVLLAGLLSLIADWIKRRK